MRVRVVAFARVREILGSPELTLELAEGASASAVWSALGGRYPQLVALQDSTRLARNGALMRAGDELREGDEVALLPPYGGG